jgi:hypothetical protein
MILNGDTFVAESDRYKTLTVGAAQTRKFPGVKANQSSNAILPATEAPAPGGFPADKLYNLQARDAGIIHRRLQLISPVRRERRFSARIQSLDCLTNKFAYRKAYYFY